ncbi:hypothetical protein ACO0LV_01815 [Pseudactinotalea sp. Z1739]|uniref:hypothetical protein n=1 Tax=Pseudactinotalea sp. Z1739 TaxID=3413028 RepID=UPI003C7B1BB5
MSNNGTLARRVEARLREVFMVQGPFTDLDVKGPDGWARHVVAIHDRPGSSVRVELDILGDRKIGALAARAVLALAGRQHTDLQAVEVVNVGGERLGYRRRKDLPMFGGPR